MTTKYKSFNNTDQSETSIDKLVQNINQNELGFNQNEPGFYLHESGLMKANEKLSTAFSVLGIYLIRWDHAEKKYAIKDTLFKLSYILWFLWPMIGLLLAYFGSQYLDIQDQAELIHTKGQTMKSLSIYILVLALIPAFQTYSICVFTKNLPSVLQDISDLSLKEDQKDTFLGYRLSDKESDISLLFNRNKDSESDNNFTYLPHITFAFAGVAFLASAIGSIVDYTNRGSVFKEWYYLVMIAFYLCLPVFSTWFCFIFIEWHRRVYRKINDNIRDDINRKEISDHMKHLGEYADKVQDIFLHLSDGVLKYPLGINMLVYVATSTYCVSRMLADTEFIYYIFPLSVSAGHIIILCARCSGLMKEYKKLLSKLKEAINTLEKPEMDEINKDDLINILHKLRENLHDSPPEVVILGSFTVDYGMLSTIIGFILSYALLINELFDDNTTVCTVLEPLITATTTTGPITTTSTSVSPYTE